MAREPRLYHELVLIDQSQFRQRQRELHASHEQSLTRFLLEMLNGLPQIPAHELRVPIHSVQRARHNILLGRVDRSGKGLHPGLHPIRPQSRPRWRPPGSLHHFVSHPAKEEGIGTVEVLDRVTMQVFVRGDCAMIAAPVQRDVDGISKGSHYVLLRRANAQAQRRREAPFVEAYSSMSYLLPQIISPVARAASKNTEATTAPVCTRPPESPKPKYSP